MSKYEKALNNVRKFEREHNMSKFGDVVPQPNSDTLQELVDKETRYQSLETELGIDLLTLFKALKDGIYYKNPFTKKIKFAENLVLCKSTTNKFYFSGFGGCLDLKDFNKTWWLEKPKENDDD